MLMYAVGRGQHGAYDFMKDRGRELRLPNSPPSLGFSDEKVSPTLVLVAFLGTSLYLFDTSRIIVDIAAFCLMLSQRKLFWNMSHSL